MVSPIGIPWCGFALYPFLPFVWWYVNVHVFGAIFFGKPEWIHKLKEGFDTLNQLPDWYIWALMAAIASSFGLKVTDLAIKKI